MRLGSRLATLLASMLVLAACSNNPTPTGSTAPQPSGIPGGAPTPGESLVSSSPAPLGSPPGSSTAPGASASPGPGTSAVPLASSTPGQPLPAYITHGKRKGPVKRLALTFDADMYPFMYANIANYTEYDPRVIKLLKDNNVHATIFANGLYLKAYPDLIKELAKQPGIEIGNHSWDHGAWPGCQAGDPLAPPVTNKKAEITKAAAIIEATVGYKSDWFRFPGFCYGSATNLDLVKSLGEWPVGNDCFFGDSAGWSTSRQVTSVKNGCTNGSIVVTHLNNQKYHPNIYEALKQLIPWWQANGWEIVNVTELMGQSPP